MKTILKNILLSVILLLSFGSTWSQSTTVYGTDTDLSKDDIKTVLVCTNDGQGCQTVIVIDP